MEENPSLGITKADDGKLLMHCFVCPDARAAQFCMAVGLTQSELYPEDAYNRGAPGHPPNKSKPKGKVVEKYDYIDRDGALRYQACRLDPKDFRQRRPNGNGGWIWNLRGVERILYRLPQLIAADSAQLVFIVEGERKADRLNALGFVATCNVGGAGKWKQSYNEFFAGRQVVILPDNDQPGADHAAKVTLALSDIAKSVRTVNLPGLKSKGDIVDWLAAGGTAAQLHELCATTQVDLLASLPLAGPVKSESLDVNDPAATHFEKELLQEIGLDVLGEVPDSQGAVKVFSVDHKKTAVISDVARLSFERLSMICGPTIKAKVSDGNESGEGYSISQVRKAIALTAGYRRLENDAESGPGCWEGQSRPDGPNDSIILVGAGEAAKWDGRALERITRPECGGRLLDIGSSDPWFDFNEQAALIQDCTPREFAESAISEAVELFSRWHWPAKSESAIVVVGLILASWIQTVWAWRPQVSITGQSNSGKSTLFEALGGIFGRLCFRSSKSSAAGIRQRLGNSATICLLDEFEDSKQRQEILNMIRAASRGDLTVMGTVRHRHAQFTLRHIFWMAAIESGLSRAPDVNRSINLEMLAPLPEMAGKLVCPPAADLWALGQRLLAVAVRNGIAARDMAVRLKAEHFEDTHPRVVESYAVPAAIVACAIGADDAGAAGILARMLQKTDTTEASRPDHEGLVDDIFASRLDAANSKYSIGQAISLRNSIQLRDELRGSLERNGICLFDDDGKEWVFVAHAILKRHALKDTTWANQNIDQILKRKPGAEKSRKRFGGRQHHGILFALDDIFSTDVSQNTVF